MVKLSVILPVRNAETTISQCLKAVFSSDFHDFEVIVVDDASSDGTVMLAESFPCKIVKFARRNGTAFSRDTGLKAANADIAVFIDSDVLIASNSLSLIEESFCAHPEAAAIVGMLSKTHPNSDFFSQYKNLYMHYIFDHCPEQIDFIYGSFFAIRKKIIQFIPVNRTYGEDTELGLRLAQEGHRIVLNKKLEVVHLKKYSLVLFLKNDFQIPFYWARLFLRQRGWMQLIEKKRFCHCRKEQLASVMLVPAAIACLFMMPWLAALLLSAYILVNIDFLAFSYRERGVLFLAKAFPTGILDSLVMASGIAAGFCSHPFKP